MIFPGYDHFPQDIFRRDVSHMVGRKTSHTGYQSVAADVTSPPHREWLEAPVGSPISACIAHHHDACLLPVKAREALQGVQKKSGQ